MKSKRIYILVLLGILIMGFSVRTYYSKIPYYKPATEKAGLSVIQHNDDTLRIAYIGDSWAALHKRIPCVIDSLVGVSLDCPVIIGIAGVGGLTSKEIYESIFSDEEMKAVIEWRPDFCYVSAGINDTNKKMGHLFYKENMRLIISLLLSHGITPIIQEIPYYDIFSCFSRMDIMPWLRAVRSMFWTWSTVDCIDHYTSAYNELIQEQQWQHQVITIRRNQWNPDGYRDERDLYYKDGMHLNEKGYLVLDSCIASAIYLHLLR